MSGRKTHFTLGQNNQNQSISVFKHSFVDFNQDFQPQQIQKKNRKTYRFDQNPITNYTTTNRQLFQNTKGAKYSELSQEKIEDLKSHHFTMGNYEAQNISVAQQNFTQKEQVNENLNQKNKNRMRQHYHQFSEQDFTNMVTAYNDQFVSNDQENNESNKETTQSKQIDVRDSHIVFGNDQVGIESIAKRDFRSVSLRDAKQQQVNQLREKLQMGTARQDFQTVNQIYLNEKQIEFPKMELTKEKVQGSHFVLGSDQNHFNSEVQRQYDQKDLQKYQDNQHLKQNNFQLGCKEFEINNQYQTNFQKNMTKYNNYYINPIKKDHIDQKNNVCLGNHNLKMASEKQAKFLHNKLEKGQKTIFQQDTDILQRNTQQQKITEFQKNFTNDKKGDVDYSYVSQQLHHFTNGQDPQDFFRTTQKGFIKHISQQSKNKHYSTSSNFRIS